ncbi:MAG: hypothetical protein NVS4B1_16060 [Ktedonobacteraceae bacterium]
MLFFGMLGDFSTHSLQALLASDIDVCAVIVPISPVPGVKQAAIQRREQPRGVRSALPLLSLHPSIVEMAWKQHIPVWEVRRISDTTTYETLALYEPDIICVACFSQRIPRSIIDLPRRGCLNVHPSLLPSNRGPVPLFWTFRNGEQVTGVTIHFLEETMDTGDILAQERIEVLDGISYAQLELRCAMTGGRMLSKVVQNVYTGNTTRTEQDATKSSYFSFPTDEDFIVHAEIWDARHVYNFINGIGHWDKPVELHVGEQIFFTRECVSYSHKDTKERPEMKQMVEVACRNGWIKLREIERL